MTKERITSILKAWHESMLERDANVIVDDLAGADS